MGAVKGKEKILFHLKIRSGDRIAFQVLRGGQKIVTSAYTMLSDDLN